MSLLTLFQHTCRIIKIHYWSSIPMELACIEYARHILYMFIMYMNLGNICIVVARLIWCWICLVEANLLLQTLEGQADKGKTRASLSSRRQLPLKSSNDWETHCQRVSFFEFLTSQSNYSRDLVDSDLILKERIDRKPIRLIASMSRPGHQRNDWKLHEFRILFVNKQILLKLHW